MVSFMAFVLQVMETLFQGTILEFLLNYQRTFLEVYNVMIQVYLNFSRSHQCNGAFNMLAFVPLDWLEDVIDVYSSIVAWSEDTFSIIAVPNFVSGCVAVWSMDTSLIVSVDVCLEIWNVGKIWIWLCICWNWHSISFSYNSESAASW